LHCAWDIQQEIKFKNDDLPENRRMFFRIGINLGDIIEEEDRIYGDGVNIAARLEGLADEGGICISGAIYDQIKNKFSFVYEYLGRKTVKNIKEPVRIYKVKQGELDADSKPIVTTFSKKKVWFVSGFLFILLAGILLSLYFIGSKSQKIVINEKADEVSAGKPSIAVLPFDNLSNDPNQEYFTDGLVDELLTKLSKISGLSVISRHSSFTYKGKSVNLRQVATELNVQYLLEGSVQRVGDRVRIRAQLIDGTTDHHIWAESYDIVIKNIFDLEDEITKKIVSTLAVELTKDEKMRVARRYTENIEAYDLYLQGLKYFNHHTKESNIQAMKMFEKAIDLDSKFANAHALLGLTYFHKWQFGRSTDTRFLDQAFELAQKAITLDVYLPEGHHALGTIYLWKKQYKKAISEKEQAIALSPNSADGFAGLAGVLNWSGKPNKAIKLVKKAMLLNPKYPFWYLWELSHGYFLTDHHEEAIKSFKGILTLNPQFGPSHVFLAAIYSEQGRMEEARAEAALIKKLNLYPSIASSLQMLPYKNQAALNRLTESLRKAGLE
jgi:adenylate cyclase